VRNTESGNGALVGGTIKRGGEQRTAEEGEGTHSARSLNLNVARFKKRDNKAAKLGGRVLEERKQVLADQGIIL